ncbi:MAG TPA: DUF3501 family protein [Dongiaceae bacterium]|jgi:hypothetical protein|nr:DUF3501 family protein [Dongiaceae bacterium]
MAARKITPADVLPPAEYAARRAELRKQVVALKRNRRIEVGPVATFYFESFETMLQQVQEMIHIEKGGEEQIEGELAAYNPLIPNGKELTATVMFEIDDPIRRGRFLARLGGVEETAFIKLDGETVKGVPEADQDRTNAEGKASSVQFIHFPFTPQQIALFREANRQVVIGFSHPEYSHMAVLPEAARAALAQDFD